MVKRDGYRDRLIDPMIDKALKAAGAVCIRGPKWCGKTWTSSIHANSIFDVGLSTNNFYNRRIAMMDPSLALEGEQPHLIDEWQDVPEIWDATRSFVDETGKKGQIILTGSSTPPSKRTSHSGAGRILMLEMNTMSLVETGDSEGSVSLNDIMCSKDLKRVCKKVGIRELICLCCRGGWPGLLSSDDESVSLVLRDYVEKAVDDASKLDGVIRDRNKISMLVRSLARNESTTVSKSTLIRDITESDGVSIGNMTVEEYLDCLRRIYFISDQPAFDPNIRSSVRVGSSVKRHLADPSLVVAALGLDEDHLMQDLNTFGFIFESLCIHDLRVYAGTFGGKVMYYRDSNGREADAVIEMPDGRYGLFEIKLGAHQIDDAANSLKRLSKAFADSGKGAPVSLCVICGLTDMAYRRDDGVYVVPITSLGP